MDDVTGVGNVLTVEDGIAWGEFTEGTWSGKSFDLPAYIELVNAEDIVISVGDPVGVVVDEDDSDCMYFAVYQTDRMLCLSTRKTAEGMEIISVEIMPPEEKSDYSVFLN